MSQDREYIAGKKSEKNLIERAAAVGAERRRGKHFPGGDKLSNVSMNICVPTAVFRATTPAVSHDMRTLSLPQPLRFLEPKTKENTWETLTSVPGCPFAASKTGCAINLANMCSRVQLDGRSSSVLVNRAGTLSNRSSAASLGLSFRTFATCHPKRACEGVCMVESVTRDRGAVDRKDDE